MNRFICIHGHFYQPPRENPWLEAIETQDSAAPYHDWNERVNAECYQANAASRILDDEGLIARIVNNYARISFNFGPTLLSWMESHAPSVYRAILEADRRSIERFGGHGAAMAQAYNHMILPLADARDKRTQVRWGIADFKARFRRDPEGMWLPETAVDTPTLEVLADEGISFVILEPHQASRWRHEDDSDWLECDETPIDPSRAYRVELPNGKNIAAFFYHGGIARAVAFEGLLNSGDRFAARLIGALSSAEDDAGRLVHIATDGETYGHHHRHGDMALAYALQVIEDQSSCELSVYGAFLERHPPTYVVEIAEKTSWSCIHGVERWRDDCGCSTGNPRFHQRWRGPMRAAFDALRDGIARRFQAEAGHHLNDPDAARDEYIHVVLNRSPDVIQRFLDKHAPTVGGEAEKSRVLKLMECQRHAMLMYTSCGWFFDDISGLEARQCIAYALRAATLADSLFPAPAGDGYEETLARNLSEAPGNLPEYDSGRVVYEKLVAPMKTDLLQVGANHAITSLFESLPEAHRVYCYDVRSRGHRRMAAGASALVLGQAQVRSRVTLEAEELTYAMLHLGDHNIVGSVKSSGDPRRLEALIRDIRAPFNRLDLPAVVNVLSRHLGLPTYSIESLFTDGQRRIMAWILEATIGQETSAFRSIFERHLPLMRFLAHVKVPLPRVFRASAELVLQSDLGNALQADPPDLKSAEKTLARMSDWDIPLDPSLKRVMEDTFERLTRKLGGAIEDAATLGLLEQALDLVDRLPEKPDLWRAQNTFYMLACRHAREEEGKDSEDKTSAQAFAARLVRVGMRLGLRMQDMGAWNCRDVKTLA